MLDTIKPTKQSPEQGLGHALAKKLPEDDRAVAVYAVMFLVAIVTIPMIQKNSYTLTNLAIYGLSVGFFVLAGGIVIRIVSGEPDADNN